jgi:hypothetical protein
MAHNSHLLPHKFIQQGAFAGIGFAKDAYIARFERHNAKRE